MNSRLTTPLLISIVLILVIVLGFLFYRNSTRQSTAEQAAVSGIFDINGPIPKDATIVLSQKEAYTKAGFQQFASGVKASDTGSWTFTGAKVRATYEITAAIVVNGKTLTTSGPITITAPATDEVLIFNIPSQNPTGTAIIAGTIDLNGYVPKGSTIVIEGKSSDIDYAAITANIPAKENAEFSYNQSLLGSEYTIRAVLYDENGYDIGTSNELTVTAPAKHEMLSINSSAQPISPTPASAGISGTIDFNGAAQQNTRIVVLQKTSNSVDNYQIAKDNISPQDGAMWQWNGGQTGTSYDLVAVLKQRQSNGTDKDIATSNIITVTAPATNESFTINSGFSLPVQNGQITSSCGTYNPENNTWSGAVTFEALPYAQAYWMQIGTIQGGDQLTNFTSNANNGSQLVYDFTFQNKTTYYARYAYSYVPNLQAYSTQFSPFSQTTSFTCTQ